MLLVGMFAAAVAEANQGPFWYHRGLNGQGKGVKISGQQGGTPFEEVRGGGGTATLEGTLGGAPITIRSSQVQVKGIVYNNALQGQAKLEFAYAQPEIVGEPGNCVVTIGNKNVVKVFGHLVWTWDNTAAQLKEQPVQKQKPAWLFTGQELQQGATTVPTNIAFTTITIGNAPGHTCLLFTPARAVEGSVVASVKPEQLGAFSTSQAAEARPNGTLQHFWNGKENIGFESGLKFANATAKLQQSATVAAFGTQGGAAQELGIWED
jgi:hypothetical protein